LRIKIYCLVIVLLLLTTICIAQEIELPIYKDLRGQIEERVEDLMSRMTLEEKIDILNGVDLNTKENVRLGIPKILMTDGPLGPTIRKHSTNYSAMINLAASFDIDLMRRVAESIGEETRVMGRNMLLAPMINIIRVPFWGRAFESFSEDPYLSSRMAVEYVKGVQSKNVIACVKVLVANNQEWNRHDIDVQVDERTLREIYFPTIKATVKEANTWSVMAAYNKVNGDYCAENKYLLTDVLKAEWGFEGFVVSDWGGTYSTVKMAKAGLDLEMPEGGYYDERLIEAIKNEKLDVSNIDDKVLRILTAMFRAGLFDESAYSYGGHSNTPERNKLARETAGKSIVLLKNENVPGEKSNCLPLNKEKIKSIAVIGPNGDVARMTAHGSGDLTGNYSISPLDGIINKVGTNIKVSFEKGIPKNKPTLPTIDAEYYFLKDGKTNGIDAEYFNSIYPGEKKVLNRIEKKIDFDWNSGGNSDVNELLVREKEDKYGSPKSGVVNTNYWSARFTGLLKSPGSGIYKLGFFANDGGSLYINDELIVDNRLADHPGQFKSSFYRFEPNRMYKIRAEYFEITGTSQFRLGMEKYVPNNTPLNNAIELAKASDVIVLCLGLNKKMEGEAFDRTELGLSENQKKLIKGVVSVNKNVVVVLNGGTPITMNGWIDDVPAVIEAFYPGQEGGSALANILFGDVNPSGKLPVTFLNRWEDSPAYGTYPGVREKAIYKEGIFVGYRWFDKKNIEPLFPFGYGLSYTTFEYSDLRLSSKSMKQDGQIEVSLNVKNTGKMTGDEVVQLYISDKKASVDREVKSLKGFQRVSLKAGESKTVTMKIDKSALAFYDVKAKKWIAEPGEFEVMIGASSRDIRLKDEFELK